MEKGHKKTRKMGHKKTRKTNTAGKEAEVVLETSKKDSTFHGGQDEMTNTKSPKPWYERRKPGLTEKDLYSELSFTAELVRKDATNKDAWSHRQWVLESLGQGYADELGLCNEILAKNHNVHNKLVWDQRCFAVTKCLASGLMIIRSCEVTFATAHILRNPENENPWRYLRFLCKGEMNALARNVHLQWTLRCVFVEARERRQAVTADETLHENKGHSVTADTLLENEGHAVLFDSVNKRGCLFALDLVLDLLSHGYEPHKEVVDAIEYLFEGPTFAERVDIVLRKHRMEVMELSADLTRMIINMPGGMETASGEITPLSDHLTNPSHFVWSKDRWVTEEGEPSEIIYHFPCSYSQLCGVAGFSQTHVIFSPEDPCLFESLKRGRAFFGREKRHHTLEVMDLFDDKGGFPLDHGGEFLRKFCRKMTELLDFDFDSFSKALVFREGHNDPVAWQARRLVILKCGLDLQKEVKILELVSEQNLKNYLFWHQRQWVSRKIGKTAGEKELKFTDNVLSKDANNYHAWSHRQWVLRELGVGWEEELEYCNKFLIKDSSNCFAWNQRYFVAGEERGVLLLSSEVVYATKAIKAEPENEMPWTYLQSLMKLRNFCPFDCLVSTCGPVLKFLAERSATKRAKDKFRLIWTGDAIWKKRVVNALKMVLFALLNFPESVDSDKVRSLWPLEGYLEHDISEGNLEHDISQTLKSIDVTWI